MNYKNLLYRIIDIIFSLLFLSLFFLIFLYLIIYLKIKIGSPIIFTQKRLGLNGKTFNIFKFRTFSNNQIIKEISHLRKYKLDEFPQIFNILKGDMTIIGPRPLKAEYFDIINQNFKLRFSVKPGLTGLVQVRPEITKWDDYFEKDYEYIKNKSIFLDIKLLIKTAISLDLYKSGPQMIDLKDYVKKYKLKKYN